MSLSTHSPPKSVWRFFARHGASQGKARNAQSTVSAGSGRIGQCSSRARWKRPRPKPLNVAAPPKSCGRCFAMPLLLKGIPRFGAAFTIGQLRKTPFPQPKCSAPPETVAGETVNVAPPHCLRVASVTECSSSSPFSSTRRRAATLPAKRGSPSCLSRAAEKPGRRHPFRLHPSHDQRQRHQDHSSSTTTQTVRQVHDRERSRGASVGMLVGVLIATQLAFFQAQFQHVVG